MTTDVALHQPSGTLALANDQRAFTSHQLAALEHMGVGDAGDGDLAVFLNQCQRTGLDPFLRQIYMIGRKSQGKTKYTIQTGIDDLRIVAERSRDYAGQTEPEWCGDDGVWRPIWLRTWGAPAAARVGVYRTSRGARPTYGVAMFEEYAQTKYDGGLTQMWATMGVLMLAKCAEALALRKAFPKDLSGLYTAEEMSQADSQGGTYRAAPQTAQEPQAPAEPGITQAQSIVVQDLARQHHLEGAKVTALIAETISRRTLLKHTTEAEAKRIIEALQAYVASGAGGFEAEPETPSEPAPSDLL